MKKAVIVMLLAFGVLAGCEGGHSDGYVTEDGRFKAVGDAGSYDLMRDLETGCLYMEAHTDRGMDPLYDKDGKVAGCGQEDKKGGDFE